MPDFADFLRSMSAGDDDASAPKITREGEIACLTDAFDALMTRHAFAPGMIVRQKPACRWFRDFSDNAISIVVEVLPKPIIGGLDNFGTDGYRVPVDLVIGEWLSSQGKFSLQHVDSRRYEPVEP